MTVKNIVVCEGRNDRVFIDETFRSVLCIEPAKLRTFEEPRFLERAIQYGGEAPVLVSEGNGFPGNARVTVRLCCRLMRHMRPLSVGVIGDADRGSVYNETANYLTQYLSTPCRVHALCPRITRIDSEEKVTISGGRINVAVWAFEIPESLEIKISRALKSRYQELVQYHDEDETIRRAAEIFGIDEESVIRRSVSFLRNAAWFHRLCNKASACMYPC